MFDKVVNKVKEEIKNLNKEETVNTAKFKDPMASQVSWKPLKKGGASFKTHHIIKVNTNEVVVKPTAGSQIFTHLFLVAGAGAIAFFLYRLFEVNGFLGVAEFASLFFGIVFCGAALYMNKALTQNKYFDKTQGYFWVGKKKPNEVYNTYENPNYTKLSDIHALQLIQEYISGSESSYYSYELNLVLTDLSRVNVTDHSNIEALREDARDLSVFLKVPLWDGVKR